MIPKHTNHLSIKIVTPLWNGCMNAGSLPAKCSDKIYIPSLGFKINSQNFEIWRRVLHVRWNRWCSKKTNWKTGTNNFTQYRVKLRKINFTQQQMKECSAEKSLPHLNHFLTEKVAKSVVRSSFLVYHLFAVRIRLLILLCLRIVCRRPRHCPCLKCFHSGCKPDEKSDGPHHLTFRSEDVV